jgi:hypothetical protein
MVRKSGLVALEEEKDEVDGKKGGKKRWPKLVNAFLLP